MIKVKIQEEWERIHLHLDFTSSDLNKKIINKIINPTLKALREKMKKLKGFYILD